MVAKRLLFIIFPYFCTHTKCYKQNATEKHQKHCTATQDRKIKENTEFVQAPS